MKIFLIAISLLFFVNSVYAQSFEERLEQLAEDNAKGYVQPLVTSFGSNLNSGLYNTASVLKPSVLRPIRFGFNINAMMAMVPSSDQTFEAKNIDGSTTETATVFGKKGGEFGGTKIYPDGFNVSMVPLFVPQVRFGLPKGNELMVRYLPPMTIGDFDDVDFWGVALKHSIDQYIPLFPLHLSVQGAYQKLAIGDVIEVNSWVVNAQASKSLLMLTIYGGLGIEGTNLKADYEYIPNADNPDTTIPVKFDIDGDNVFRMTAGLRYTLLPFVHINADYSLSTYQIISLGFGMAF